MQDKMQLIRLVCKNPSQRILIVKNYTLESSLDLENLLVKKSLNTCSIIDIVLIVEVYEGTYRKTRVAIKILKESNSAELFLHEASIMRSVEICFDKI